MIWQGRNDGNTKEHNRLHNIVQLDEKLLNINKDDFCIIGFCVDEGVKKNLGRIGAAKAPNIIRNNMANFPVFNENLKIKDLGNIYLENENLEKTQQKLAVTCKKVYEKNAKTIVLGGGHEITFAHYSGLTKAFPNKKIGIINIDAHFDNRKPENGATSGTGFWQIAQNNNFTSLHIGIQKNSNTKKLFQTAENYKMDYILADDINLENITSILDKIENLIENSDVIYLTICMDVFNVSIAPGVSAIAYYGIFADYIFMKFYRKILSSEKLIALDVAEVNPDLDPDFRTARLAASLINEWFLLQK